MFPAKRVAQSKQLVKSGQGKSSRTVKNADGREFGSRFREAFGGATNAEIARKIGKSEPAVKNYVDGRIPSAADLVAISDLTGCSVHWLLTGNGPREVSQFTLAKQSVEPATISLTPELKSYIRREVIEVLGALISSKDRELVDSLLSAISRPK